MRILSNTALHGVQNQVRENALSSFEFFSNSVLSSGLSIELCEKVQDAIEEEEDEVFQTQRPRALALAIVSWLSSKGVAVLCSQKIPQSEVLHWLNLIGVEERTSSLSAVLTLGAQSVQLQWV